MTEFPTLKRLFPDKVAKGKATKKDISAAVEAAAELLKRGKDVGNVELRVVGSKGRRSFTLDVRDGECLVEEAGSEARDLRVAASEDTWVEIANGDLSPVDAYLTGRLELAGNLGFAKRQFAKLMSRGDIDALPI